MPEPTSNNLYNQQEDDNFIESFLKRVRDWFRDLVNLEKGLDREGTIIGIRKNMRMRGHSAWLLMCSILIASIGLDQNSPAVIIGAMLISPLMSPILGVGLAIGVNDKNMLSISLQHFMVSILIALTTSYLYFQFTPFGGITPEIDARTRPNTLDVIIAFFGGLAGIISGTRKEVSNAIPGVAIATALMPPLCVTGYGLAKGYWGIALNSFYLFFLNAFFVALATYLIVRYLNFAEREFNSNKERKITQFVIAGFSLLMILPSAYFLYDQIGYLTQRNKVEEFIQEYFSGETQCIDHNITKKDSSLTVVLRLIGPGVPEDSVDIYEDKLTNMVGYPCELDLVQSPGDVEQINELRSEVSLVRETTSKMKDFYDNAIVVQNNENRTLQNQLDSILRDTIPFKEITEQVKIFIPTLEQIAFAKMQSSNFETAPELMPTLLIRWNKGTPTTTRRKEEKKLYQFVTDKAQLDTLLIVSY